MRLMPPKTLLPRLRVKRGHRPSQALSLAMAASASLAGLLPAQAGAATTSTSFSVTATVATACTATASNLAFGAYDSGNPAGATASSAVNVTCSLGAPYTISLDNGTYASGAVRRLGSGTSRLNYEIYRDVGLTGVFGLASSLLGVSGVGTGVSIPTQVFGRIATGQSVAPGNYTDQITVTIDY